ncbi:MAG: YchJ family protein, partial [Psychrobacter sp.]
MQPSLQTCPCQINPASTSVGSTPLSYQDCCQPYHDAFYNDKIDQVDGMSAETAERLMRSRYSAFVLVKPD